MRHTTVDERVVAGLADLDGVQLSVGEAADTVVNFAQLRAPKDTGDGAASIHKEPLPADGDAEAGWAVSWDDEHDYMRFPEFGTERMAATPFLRPAAEAVGNQVVETSTQTQ